MMDEGMLCYVVGLVGPVYAQFDWFRLSKDMLNKVLL
jgi:hypothetical protein